MTPPRIDSSNPSRQDPARVLVVEDDPCAAQAYKMLLQKEGYDLQLASDGQAALDAVTKERFDAVVLDLMMPKVDGIQVLKAIRAGALNPLVPVIIITAARLKVVEEEAFRFGVKLFLDKTQASELVQGLRQIMANRLVETDVTLRMAPVAPIDARRSRTPAEFGPNPVPVSGQTPPFRKFRRLFSL